MTDQMWQWIRECVEAITNGSPTNRFDATFGGATVLVYKAGTVIRVDFKGIL